MDIIDSRESMSDTQISLSTSGNARDSSNGNCGNSAIFAVVITAIIGTTVASSLK